MEKLTIGAQGNLLGIYTPEARVYHGKFCEVFKLKFLGKTRDRKEALRRGMKWVKRPGATQAAEISLKLLYAGSRENINVHALIQHVLDVDKRE